MARWRSNMPDPRLSTFLPTNNPKRAGTIWPHSILA